VLILVDDATRKTPTARFLPHVMAELSAAGIADDRIEFLAAPGTHRELTEAEWKLKLGPFFGRYRTHQHHWLEKKELKRYGTTKDGTPVTANKLLAEFDFILGLGSIVPHRIKGLSGGAKIMFPGVAGREMMDRNQWEASMRMSETVMGVPENSMRLRMEEAARIAGLSYIVNVVYDVQDHIVGCFTGDMVIAHRAGCKRSAEVYAVHLADRADIVIIDSHSADRDFWQSAKGLYAGTMATREGVTMILVSPNPEGLATNHPIMLQIGYRPHAEIVKLAQSGKTEDLVGLAVLGDLAQIVDHHDCIIASPGIRPEEAKKIGLRWAASTGEALKMALEKQGGNAKIAVIRYGGHVLPVVATEQLRGSQGVVA
jgi:nickel-dependent lactate racemase